MLALLSPQVIKILVIALLVVAVGGTAYRTAYNHGKLSGNLECVEETEHLVKQINERITAVEMHLDNIADMAENQQQKIAKEIDVILKQIKTKPVMSIKNNKCVPSREFVEGLNKAISIANQK